MSTDKCLAAFAGKTGLPGERLQALILGKDVPGDDEVVKICDAFGFTPEELYYGNLLDEYQVNVITENIRYLFRQLPRGGITDFAKWTGIDESTVHRWIRKGQTPGKEKLKKIKEYFQLNESEELERDLLFLNLEPVGDVQRKKECIRLLEQMPPHEFSKIYPALKKLLS